jgi:hypothetical protein
MAQAKLTVNTAKTRVQVVHHRTSDEAGADIGLEGKGTGSSAWLTNLDCPKGSSMQHLAPPSEPWVDQRLAALRPSPIEGQGLFAREAITGGTVVVRLGGRLVDSEELASLIKTAAGDAGTLFEDSLTIYEDAHLIQPPHTIVHYVNHSCDPSLWLVGPYDLAARRNIRIGEELTFDYATIAAAVALQMVCSCRSVTCRGKVSGEDWHLPQLQARYRDHWIPAVSSLISGKRTTIRFLTDMVYLR